MGKWNSGRVPTVNFNAEAQRTQRDAEETLKPKKQMFISNEKAEQAFAELDALIEEQLGQEPRRIEA